MKKISKAGRARMAEAGRLNLSQWRSRARTRANEIQAQVDTFRAGLLHDAGASLTTTKAGLIEAAVSTYAGVLKIRHALINSRRSDVGELSERVSFLSGNLCRLLKTLNLDYVPPPRTLADLVARQQAAKLAEKGPKLTDSEEIPRV